MKKFILFIVISAKKLFIKTNFLKKSVSLPNLGQISFLWVLPFHIHEQQKAQQKPTTFL